MNLTKIFEDSLGKKCFLTDHSLLRIKQRFNMSEMYLIRFLLTAGAKTDVLSDIKENQKYAIVDTRFAIGVIFKKNIGEEDLKIITVIRGKDTESYQDCTVASVSISKEKAEFEAREIAASSAQKKGMRI